MDIDVRIDRPRGRITLSVTGELDLLSSASPIEAFGAFAAPTYSRVILNLGRLELCDCTGLGALVQVHQEMSRAGGTLQIRELHPLVRRLIQTADCVAPV